MLAIHLASLPPSRVGSAAFNPQGVPTEGNAGMAILPKPSLRVSFRPKSARAVLGRLLSYMAVGVGGFFFATSGGEVLSPSALTKDNRDEAKRQLAEAMQRREVSGAPLAPAAAGTSQTPCNYVFEASIEGPYVRKVIRISGPGVCDSPAGLLLWFNGAQVVTAQGTIRWDRLLGLLGAFAGALISFALGSPAGTEALDDLSRDLPEDKRKDEAEAKEARERERLPEAALLRQIARLEGSSSELLRRSLWMLAGGLLMAFVGVGVFSASGSASLPGSSQAIGGATDEPWIKGVAALSPALRPALMLVFLEAIAFFLLRQYRSLIEDYKAFYRVTLRASNSLAALRLLGATEEGRQLAAAALFHEDPSFRWEGANQEAVTNPIFELLQGMLPKKGGAGKTAPDDKQ
jgi:hypothetical protein